MAEYALPGIFVMGCLVYLMESYVIRCPEQAEWNIRAEILCQNTTTYFCLYNYITYSYEEGCTGPDWDRPGSKRVYARNFNRAPCRYTRYQPIKFVTGGNSDCIFRKSLCTNEGQTLFEAGTTKTDSTCRCDYKRGYAFVTVPRNKCSCRPSEEDCSCYLKKCQGIGYNLSADYECTKNGTKKTVCPLMSENPSEDPHIDMTPTGTPREDDSYAIRGKWVVFIVVLCALIGMIVSTVITMCIMLRQRLPRCPCLSTEQSVPVVNVESTSYSTNVGTRVTLQCTITANPSHTSVGWQRVLSNGNTQPIDMTNSRYSGVALGSPSLIIDNTIKTDEGKYVCIATNLVGSGQSQQTYLTVVGSVPVVNVESTSYSTNVGTRVTLQCTITANPSHTSVGWQRVLSNGNTQPIDMTNSRYSGVALGSPSLIIDNTIKTDEGKYVCIATNLVGSGQSQQTYLTVVGSVPVVNVESTSYSTNVGTRVTLQCTITANPSHTSVGWQRVLSNGNTQPIDMTNSRYSGVALGSPSLIIDNTIKTDEGKYVCIATNLVGSGQSQQTYLTVVGSVPVVNVESTSYSTNVGTRVTLQCTITANPSHTSVGWQRVLSNGNTQPIDMTNSRYSGVALGSPSLIIDNTIKTDEGKYVCIATNLVGSGQSQQTYLTVVGSVPVVNVESTSYSTNVGTRVTLQCTITANPSHTSVGWQSVLSNGNTQPIDMTNSRYSGVALGSPSLIIDNTIKTDEGKYVCIATNLVGSGQSQQTYLTVVGNGIRLEETVSGNNEDNQIASREMDEKWKYAFNELKDNIKKVGRNAALKQFKKDLEKWRNEPVKLAVTGKSGVGKSSFINAICNWKPGYKGFATTSCLGSTTKFPTVYEYPRNPKITLHDLPGFGTTNCPKKEYEKIMKLDRYDSFLIFVRNIEENDIEIAKKLKEMGKPFCFVRSKLDVDIKNAKNDSVPEAEVIEKIMSTFLANLENNGCKEAKCFVISNHNQRIGHFNELVLYIQSNLPELKCDVVMFSMFGELSDNMIDSKYKLLKDRLLKVSVTSIGLDTSPVSDMDRKFHISLICKEFLLYHKAFGFDQKIVKDILKDDSIKRMLKASSIIEIQPTDEAMCEFVKSKLKKLRTSDARKSVIIPLIESVVSMWPAGGDTIILLNQVLDSCRDDAQLVYSHIRNVDV